MELLKAQLARIQQQLAGLSASQKMLAGALAVIMVMTLLYSARYAGTAEFEPLLDQAFTQEEVVNITGSLNSQGIPTQVTGDRISIPVDKKWHAMAILGYEQLLPSNTSVGFDKIVQQMSPWDSAALTEAKLNEFRAASLTQIIKRFPGVRDATVVIDPTSKRRIGETFRASAMVYITMKQQGGKPGKQLVEAAAACVAGSQAGMNRSSVTVVVDGVSQRVSDLNDVTTDGMNGSDLLDSIAANERYFTRKIADQLSFLPDARISVTVSLDNKSTREQVQEYDPKKTFSKPQTEDSRTEENINSAPAVAEPGAVPNTGMSLAGTGAGGSTNTTTEEKTTYAQFPSVRTANIVTPAGMATVVSATVRVPQSYFAGIWMSKNPGGKEPSDDVIATMASAEFPKIRADVMNCTGLKDATAISVETYADMLPTLMATTSNGGSTASSLPLGLGSYGKEIAIGVLALVSLFMVSTMVKKGTPVPVALGPIEDELPPQLHNGEQIAGEAGMSEQMLDGMELDDDSIRAQQMIDQVSTMVKENPDGAASLVKRWMNK